MIFLKVLVGMRKIGTLTMEKNVRLGKICKKPTSSSILSKYHLQYSNDQSIIANDTNSVKVLEFSAYTEMKFI